MPFPHVEFKKCNGGLQIKDASIDAVRFGLFVLHYLITIEYTLGNSVLIEDVFKKSGPEVKLFLNRDDIRIVKCNCLQESEFLPYIKDKIRNCQKNRMEIWHASNARTAADSTEICENKIQSTLSTPTSELLQDNNGSSPQVLFTATAITPPTKINAARSVSIDFSLQQNFSFDFSQLLVDQIARTILSPPKVLFSVPARQRQQFHVQELPLPAADASSSLQVSSSMAFKNL
jgi:hypothetical protein